MEARAETVSVRLARSSERHLIENLSQFYIYDFSEMEPPGSDKMEFGDQGRYSGLSDLNSYWRVEGFRPRHWEVAVAECNLAARVFWPRALAAAPSACQPVFREGDGTHWRGSIWSFRAADRI
jgi:predicted acetyltransferase